MSDARVPWTFEPTGDARRRGARERISHQMEALSQAPLFAGLSKRHLRKIADASAVTSFAPGKEIVTEGVAGSVFFVILEGEAKVTRGGRRVARLRPGDYFGEMSVIVGLPRTASIVSETPMRCLTLSAKNLRQVLAEEPGIALKMLERVTRRLAELERPLVS